MLTIVKHFAAIGAEAMARQVSYSLPVQEFRWRVPPWCQTCCPPSRTHQIKIQKIRSCSNCRVYVIQWYPQSLDEAAKVSRSLTMSHVSAISAISATCSTHMHLPNAHRRCEWQLNSTFGQRRVAIKNKEQTSQLSDTFWFCGNKKSFKRFSAVTLTSSCLMTQMTQNLIHSTFNKKLSLVFQFAFEFECLLNSVVWCCLSFFGTLRGWKVCTCLCSEPRCCPRTLSSCPYN